MTKIQKIILWVLIPVVVVPVVLFGTWISYDWGFDLLVEKGLSPKAAEVWVETSIFFTGSASMIVGAYFLLWKDD